MKVVSIANIKISLEKNKKNASLFLAVNRVGGNPSLFGPFSLVSDVTGRPPLLYYYIGHRNSPGLVGLNSKQI